MSVTCSIPWEVRGSRKLWALLYISLFVISLTSNNRQTKGWLFHRRVWQQTQSVWQQTSSRSGNRQNKEALSSAFFSEQTLRLRVWQQSNRPSGNRQNHCHTVDRAMSRGDWGTLRRKNSNPPNIDLIFKIKYFDDTYVYSIQWGIFEQKMKIFRNV